jgi:hypothetical protein
MLSRDQYEELKRKHGSEQFVDHIDADILQDLSSELLAMGAAVVVLKLGEHGLYMRSTAEESRLTLLVSAHVMSSSLMLPAEFQHGGSCNCGLPLIAHRPSLNFNYPDFMNIHIIKLLYMRGSDYVC